MDLSYFQKVLWAHKIASFTQSCFPFHKKDRSRILVVSSYYISASYMSRSFLKKSPGIELFGKFFNICSMEYLLEGVHLPFLNFFSILSSRKFTYIFWSCWTIIKYWIKLGEINAPPVLLWWGKAELCLFYLQIRNYFTLKRSHLTYRNIYYL